MDARLAAFLAGLAAAAFAATLVLAFMHGEDTTCRREALRCEAVRDVWGPPVSWLSAGGLAGGLALALLARRGAGPALLVAACLLALLAGGLAILVGGYFGIEIRCERTPGGDCVRGWRPWGLPLATAGTLIALAALATLAAARRSRLP